LNYIFLDIDGVLNDGCYSTKQHKKYGGRFFAETVPFNPRSLRNLKKIIDKTGGIEHTVIVLTSTWRKLERNMIVLEARLMEYGIKIIRENKTENMNGQKGKEIERWLKENDKVINYFYADNKEYEVDIPNESNFIIIDDETYDIRKYFTPDHIIKVNGYKGLDFWKTKEAIHKLNNPKRIKTN